MQTVYKLIFAILVLKARKDELRARTLQKVRASKRDLSRGAALPPSDAALAQTR